MLVVFIDAIKVKSRLFVIVIASICVLINAYNIYGYTFLDWDQSVVLLKYTIQGEEYTFMLRSTKRSIFFQVTLFGMNAVYTMLKDKKMELMIFATGNIISRDRNRVEGGRTKIIRTKDKIREEEPLKKDRIRKCCIVRLFQTPITLSFDFNFI